jgi:ketosteroid isomerase-like protein
MMKTATVLASILLAIALSGCRQAPTGADTNSTGVKPMENGVQDTSDLKALEERFATAFRAKDVDAIMQLCVPDDSLVVFDVHPPLQVGGGAAYRKDWEEFFKRFSGPLEADVSAMNVTAGADVAYAHYIHHVRGTAKTGKKVDYALRVTDCFKKIDGRWLIVHTHVSVPVDMATGKADLESKP